MSARRLAAALIAAALLVSGCASAPPQPGEPARATVRSDPWESWNRKVFAFNEAVDEAVLKPVAQVWRDAVPALVRRGVSNFFGNIGDAWSAANHFLQGKVQAGFEMGMRVTANTLFGLGGVLDPATEFGLERRSEDFGQTLAVWGVPNGPYVVLPLLGPSTLRDTVVLPLDRWGASPSLFAIEWNAYALVPLQVVQVRSELLETTSLVEQAALDKYSFVRNAWLARRRDLVFDGAPPLEPLDDFADDPKPDGGNKPK